MSRLLVLLFLVPLVAGKDDVKYVYWLSAVDGTLYRTEKVPHAKP